MILLVLYNRSFFEILILTLSFSGERNVTFEFTLKNTQFRLRKRTIISSSPHKTELKYMVHLWDATLGEFS